MRITIEVEVSETELSVLSDIKNGVINIASYDWYIVATSLALKGLVTTWFLVEDGDFTSLFPDYVDSYVVSERGEAAMRLVLN